MIQRIQTVYLLVATILNGTFFLLPLFSQSLLKDAINGQEFGASDNTLLLTFSIMLILLHVVAIFLFNNRKAQIKVIWSVVLINIGLTVILGYWYIQLNSDLMGKLTLNLGVALPVIILVLDILAVSSVKKDENLVKSLDRLR